MAHAYSYSKIESFNQCPRKYKFENIERAKVEKPVGVETYLGNAVHQVLEHVYRLKLDNRLLEAAEAMGRYNEIWENGPDKDEIKVTRENLSIDDYIETGREIVRKYYDKYYPFDNGMTLALEKNFQFPLDTEGKFTIRGKIDRLAQQSDDTVEIIDYKTKSTLTTQTALDDDNQMGLYHLGVAYLWPDFKDVVLKQVFLRHGVELKTRMTEDKLEEIRYRTFQKILEIEQSVREDNFPPKESRLCDWCVYSELCPAKRHRLALDDEIETEFDAAAGAELAEKYLELDFKKKTIEAELKALKEDLVRYCEQADLSQVESSRGNLKVSISETEAFPGKTKSENDYYELSLLARQAKLEECFKLDQNVLYKEFYLKERLPEELMEKLRSFLVKLRQIRVLARHRTE